MVDIFLPPLRDRREDIPLLVQHFLARFNDQHSKAMTDVPPDVMKMLMVHAWPGNIRELMHLVERAVIFSDGSELSRDLLPQEVRGSESAEIAESVWRDGVFFQDAKHEVVASFEIAFIRSALEYHNGNISRTSTGHWHETAGVATEVEGARDRSRNLSVGRIDGARYNWPPLRPVHRRSGVGTTPCGCPCVDELLIKFTIRLTGPEIHIVSPDFFCACCAILSLQVQYSVCTHWAVFGVDNGKMAFFRG